MSLKVEQEEEIMSLQPDPKLLYKTVMGMTLLPWLESV